MKRGATAGVIVAGVVAVGLAGAITLNAMQTSSHTTAGAAPSITTNAAPSTSGAAKTPSATPGATNSAPATNPVPSSQAAAPAATASAQPEATVAPAAPAPAPAAPAPAPAPAAQGLDAAGIQHIKDSCTTRLQSDAAKSAVVTGTSVPRPFTIVSIAFSGAPTRSTGTSGLPAYDIVMNTTTKLVDGPTQDGQRICRVYDSDTRVDWLPVG